VGQYANIEADRGSGSLKIDLYGVAGKHLVYPIAAAVAVALELGLEQGIEGALGSFPTPPGRMRLLSGVSSSVIIDDTYNSSPIACVEALKTLGSISTKGKKIAVLGDMKELGELSEKAHREVGAFAGDIVHTLVLVGGSAKYFAEGARQGGLSAERIFEAKDSVEAGKMVKEILRAGDIVLVKGSQSMRMERAVKLLLAEGQDAEKLLVRQEPEWAKR
jgi:UDP-N-acetylmuramoyl-tripeptide--D-alanyl-D-alanine ligase